MVSDLESAGTALDISRVSVMLGGATASVAEVMEQVDSHRVLVYVPDSAPTGNHLPLTVSIDSRDRTRLPSRSKISQSLRQLS